MGLNNFFSAETIKFLDYKSAAGRPASFRGGRDESGGRVGKEKNQIAFSVQV